jgi:hypothetical protein
MIRAIGHDQHGPMIFMGLDDENLRRLTAGQPVKVDLDDFAPGQPDLPSISICVFYATPESVAQLQEGVLQTHLKVEMFPLKDT